MNAPEQPATCITCGQPFTIPPNNPRKRYCSPRCRVADWHTRNDRRQHINTTENDTVPNAVQPPNAVPNGVQTINGVQHCPHCHGQLAVIAVLVPPTAAHIPTPEVSHMSPT